MPVRVSGGTLNRQSGPVDKYYSVRQMEASRRAHARTHIRPARGVYVQPQLQGSRERAGVVHQDPMDPLVDTMVDPPMVDAGGASFTHNSIVTVLLAVVLLFQLLIFALLIALLMRR